MRDQLFQDENGGWLIPSFKDPLFRNVLFREKMKSGCPSSGGNKKAPAKEKPKKRFRRKIRKIRKKRKVKKVNPKKADDKKDEPKPSSKKDEKTGGKTIKKVDVPIPSSGSASVNKVALLPPKSSSNKMEQRKKIQDPLKPKDPPKPASSSSGLRLPAPVKGKINCVL